MPATLAALQHSAAAVVSDACRDCRGSLITWDDGSVTGHAGELIPCGCAVNQGPACRCQILGWPLNDGFTGWVALTPAEMRHAPEDAPLVRPCPEHNASARTVAREVGRW